MQRQENQQQQVHATCGSVVTSYLSSAGRFVCRHSWPLFGAGRAVASTGGSVYSTNRLIDHIAGKDYPYRAPIIATAAFATAYMNISIRVFAMYLQQQKKAHPHQEPIRLGCGAQSLSLALQSILFLSVSFSGLGSFLGAIGLIENISQLDDEHVYNDPAIAAPIIIFAAYIVISNVLSNAARPLKTARMRARQFAKNITSCSLPCDRYAAATFATTMCGLAVAPFQGYFTATHAIQKLPLFPKVGNMTNTTMTGSPSNDSNYQSAEIALTTVGVVSAITLLCYQLLTQVPAVRERYSKTQLRTNSSIKKHCLDKPFSISVKLIGMIDFITTLGGTYIAIMSTLDDRTSIDTKNDYRVIIPAIVASLSVAVMQYMFGVLDNFARVKADYYAVREARREALLTHQDVERGESSDTASIDDGESDGISRIRNAVDAGYDSDNTDISDVDSTRSSLDVNASDNDIANLSDVDSIVSIEEIGSAPTSVTTCQATMFAPDSEDTFVNLFNTSAAGVR